MTELVSVGSFCFCGVTMNCVFSIFLFFLFPYLVFVLKVMSQQIYKTMFTTIQALF